MKGVLFNVVEDVVTEALSAEDWDDIIDQAGVHGAYTSLGNYDDAELFRIVDGVAKAADLSVADTLRLSGRLGFAQLAKRLPHVLDGFEDWQSVLDSLDDIIHPEVKKIYADAEVPSFATEHVTNGLLVTYTSRRKLCALADGLIVGAGSWFGARLTVAHESCVHDGDADCTMRVTSDE